MMPHETVSELPRRTQLSEDELRALVPVPLAPGSIADIDWRTGREPWPEEELSGLLVLGASLDRSEVPDEVPGHIRELLGLLPELKKPRSKGSGRKKPVVFVALEPELSKAERKAIRRRIKSFTPIVAPLRPTGEEDRTVGALVRAAETEELLGQVLGHPLRRLLNPNRPVPYATGLVLGELARHRRMTTDQLKLALDEKPSRVDTALQKLKERGLVMCLRFSKKTSGQVPNVWQLKRPGWNVGKAAGVIRRKAAPEKAFDPPDTEDKLERVRHDLAAVQVAAEFSEHMRRLGAGHARFSTPALTSVCRFSAEGARSTWETVADRDFPRVVSRGTPKLDDGNDARLPKDWLDVSALEPDAAVDVGSPEGTRTVRLLFEVDFTQDVPTNLHKVISYDRALSGWIGWHPLFSGEGHPPDALPPVELSILTLALRDGAPSDLALPEARAHRVPNRPLIVFVMETMSRMWRLRAAADRYAVAQVVSQHAPARYAGRHGIVFTTLAAITSEHPAVVTLPPQPPHVRKEMRLSDTPEWRELRPPTDLR